MEMHWALLFTLVLETFGAPALRDGRQNNRFEAKYIRTSEFQSRMARSLNDEECNQYEICNELYDPVCGTDGITHDNECKLKQASCQNPEMNIEIAYHSPCSRENEPYTINEDLITDDPENEYSTPKTGRERQDGSTTEPSTMIDHLMTDNPENKDSSDIFGSTVYDESMSGSYTISDDLMTDAPNIDAKTHIIGHADQAGSMPESNSFCISDVTQDVVPKGNVGYYRCFKFECIGNNTWRNTTEMLPGCSPGEVKCWNWYKTENIAVPIGSVMFHKCTQYNCTENDWARTSNRDPSCSRSVTGGCTYQRLDKVVPLGTIGYHQCDQMECKSDHSFQPTGERLANCSAGSVVCWNWITNETVPVGGTIYFECNQYLCTEEHDWDYMQNSEHDPSCEANYCISEITKYMVPEGVKGYYMCDLLECMGNNTWRNTTEKLPGCSPDEMKCQDWNQPGTVAVPIGSVMFYKCVKYHCTKNDWAKTSIRDPSCTGPGGCMYTTVNKLFPLGTKGYHKCEQVECKSDKSWQPTGEILPNCSAGSVACWNWMTNETVLAGGTMVFECNQYSCTEHDWQWVQYTAEYDSACEINSCICEITQDVVPAGNTGYMMCDQYECMGNNTWRNTKEKLPGCSPVDMKCWNWYQNETVAIGNVMFHKCMQYICTQHDWTKTSILDPSCSVAGGCMYSNVNKVFPLGTKGYHKCEQVECKSNHSWEPTGERLTYCAEGRVACWNWVKNVTVPVGGTMVLECNQYSCTEEHDWQWVQFNVENDPSCEISGCVSQITEDEVTKGFKEYHLCDQFECIGNNTWRNTTERLPGCSSGEVKCWDWKNQTGTVSVPIGSVMFHKCMQYKCTEGDWVKTMIHDPSCSVADGCMYNTVNKIFPLGTKGYRKCDQVECKHDKTWQPTGEKLPNCSAGSVKCWNWMVNEAVPLTGTMFFECNWYSCTENDWQWVKYTTSNDAVCEMKSCISDITKDSLPEGTKGYYLCDQIECMGKNTWRNTAERLPGCSPGEVKCWDWYQTETENVAVSIGSVMFHNCLQYNCTENDWKKTSIRDPSCPKISQSTPVIPEAKFEFGGNQTTQEMEEITTLIGTSTEVIAEERFDIGDFNDTEATYIPEASTSASADERAEIGDVNDTENIQITQETKETTMSDMETPMNETTMNDMKTTMSDVETVISKIITPTEDTSDSSKHTISLLCALLILLLQIEMNMGF